MVKLPLITLPNLGQCIYIYVLTKDEFNCIRIRGAGGTFDCPRVGNLLKELAGIVCIVLEYFALGKLHGPGVHRVLAVGQEMMTMPRMLHHVLP